MTYDEFLELVASEPNRTEERDVRIAAPALVADLERSGGIRMAEFLADPRHAIERRTFRKGHVLDSAVSPSGLAEWRQRWPRHPLPQDLVELLVRVNGIHLWADLAEGRSYEGLAPLEEWGLARVKMWGAEAEADSLADCYLALSYNADGATFITLNVDTGQYFLMDPCGADETCPLGSTVSELLDWLWDHRIR